MTAYTDTVGVTVTHVTRSFDPANRLITATQSAQTTNYNYDDNGNLLQITPPGTGITTSYGYNQRNMLVTVTQTVSGTTATVSEYRYDGDNARYQQIDYSSGLPITTTYHNDIVGLSQVLIADDGTTQTANLFGLDLIASDDGTTTLTMLPDGLDSVRVEMQGEAVNSTTTYEPYGTLLMRTGPSGTVYGYTGEQMDGATGLTYLRARYYNPILRVFNKRDPWKGNLLYPKSLQGYDYAIGNPVNYSDPSGNCIVQYSGEVRMNQYPYGTSGVCPNTESPLIEGNAAMYAYHQANNPLPRTTLVGGDATHSAIGFCERIDTYLQCWEKGQSYPFQDNEQINVQQFAELEKAVYELFFNADKLALISRMLFDTPFHNDKQNPARDTMVCLGSTCFHRSEVNYWLSNTVSVNSSILRHQFNRRSSSDKLSQPAIPPKSPSQSPSPAADMRPS